MSQRGNADSFGAGGVRRIPSGNMEGELFTAEAVFVVVRGALDQGGNISCASQPAAALLPLTRPSDPSETLNKLRIKEHLRSGSPCGKRLSHYAC